MKRAWIFPLTLAAALPLFAQNAQETKSNAKPETKTTTEQTETAVAPAATPQTTGAPKTAGGGDSPLVAAAKRARRGKTSKIVITNETLAQSSGKAHITTTDKQAPVPATVSTSKEPAESQWEQEQRQQKVAAEAAAKKTEEQEKLAKKAAAAEEGYDGGQGDDADEFVGSAPPPPMH